MTHSTGSSPRPRVCGEHKRGADIGLLNGGSSPRVRGTQMGGRASKSHRRFIPACAGNTHKSEPACRRKSVYPRVCGEHLRVGVDFSVTAGSSPRVRGTHNHVEDSELLNRFIPACAGNTKSMVSKRQRLSVHPRVCGEHSDGEDAARADCGSSPRVRGTQLLRRRPRSSLRFIPACAGNTGYRVPSAPARAVHPRVCGEHRIYFLK